MILLLDIGNSNTHAGLGSRDRILRHVDFPTLEWKSHEAVHRLRRLAGRHVINGVALCSVVPQVTRIARATIRELFGVAPFELTCRTVRGVGIDYPRPRSIGPDRLANAAAARRQFGAPVVVVDFGTAVTLDVVDRRGNYVGGVIAPGLAAMTDYLHEKTALLPRIRIRETRTAIGKSTNEAMRIGAVQGYRGLIRELIGNLKRELKAPRLPVIATGGYAGLISARMPEITAVEPLLTLEGVHWVFLDTRSGN